MDAAYAGYQTPMQYGAVSGSNGANGGKLARMKRMIHESKTPSFMALVGMVVVPWLIFTFVFYIRSFDLHYSSELLCEVLSFVLVAPAVVFAYMTANLLINGSDPIPMAFLTIATVLCWANGYKLGDNTYTSYMKPYYELTELNIYPHIDPTKWQGSQLMDAGMIQFDKGSRLQLNTSIGFKNDDVYCVAPIVLQNATTKQTVPMSAYDFWAVGTNCCSGHIPDFQCGEYSNPSARWGLRVMDEEARDMYRLAVKEAEAAFNLNAPHPIFMHWMQDPQAEVQAYHDDGFKNLLSCTGITFAVLFGIVLCFAFLLHTIF